jgi:methionine-rich copper-binding protein CopC
MLKRTSMAVFVLFAMSLMMAPSANAHPTLKSASPPSEGVTVSAPTEIKLIFSEGVIPKFSSVELKDQGGEKIAIGKVAANPKDPKELVVALREPLKAGTYIVTWNIVSVDTHRVHGTYSFKVGG